MQYGGCRFDRSAHLRRSSVTRLANQLAALRVLKEEVSDPHFQDIDIFLWRSNALQSDCDTNTCLEGVYERKIADSLKEMSQIVQPLPDRFEAEGVPRKPACLLTGIPEFSRIELTRQADQVGHMTGSLQGFTGCGQVPYSTPVDLRRIDGIYIGGADACGGRCFENVPPKVTVIAAYAKGTLYWIQEGNNGTHFYLRNNQ